MVVVSVVVALAAKVAINGSCDSGSGSSGNGNDHGNKK